MLTAVVVVASAAAVSLVPAAPAHAATVTVGAGSYTTDLPAGATGPADTSGAAVTPKVTANAAGRPVPTNDWWSSLAFRRYPGNPYSENMYAHPLAFRAVASGLEVSYPTNPLISADGRQYEYPHARDLTLGVTGLNAPETRVDGWSDWTVTPHWTDGARTLKATIGHGMPFVQATATGGDARIAFVATPAIWADRGNVLGVTVNGHHYALFSPSGTDWNVSGTVATANLGGRDYFSVAVLPSTGALDLFANYAFSFVTGTTVNWSYDSAAARLTTTYTAATAAKEGTRTGTLLALYRHQWQATSDALTAHTYVSPRGQMKLREGASFTTRQTFTGVLPSLPDLGAYDRTRLRDLVRQEANAADPWKGAADTYWTGKALGRLAQLVPIADQLGDTATRDKLLGLLKGELQSWFTAGGEQFRYDAAWGALTGYPASYGSDSELNDHHFHYGYYLMAAATVARYDAAWAADGQWGGMAKLLARDANNWVRSDTRFPFLRNFDPYAGNGWASGHQGFAAGNNEESSSEAMNFAVGALLLGEATGDTGLRDLGIYLYTTQAATIAQYWYDADNAVFPASFQHDTLGMIWGNGGAYATWWTANPEEIHGINMLPITAGSLYQRDIQQNLAEMTANNGGPAVEWRDIIWQFQALADPAGAKAAWDAGWNSYEPESGDSKAHTYHWIYNLAKTGTPDRSVTANVPTAAVFASGGTRTYVAHNFGTSSRTVTFSDGKTLTVPARATATSTGTGGGGPDPGPSTGDTLYLRDGAAVGVTGRLTTDSGTGAATDTVASAGGVNHDGTPYQPLVYEITGVSGRYDPAKASGVELYLDAGTTVALGTQARVSYDLTGDGTFERVETYPYFATDPVAGWERYAASTPSSATGSLGDMSGGRVRLEVWSAIGNGTTQLRVEATAAQGSRSLVRIPLP
ncbi:endoglucanase Acf2 [Thermocatellispora tengchongensis]|uniref:glucan endo-1,3-beta-D-glucosidase n=1 Tax=Thermocatellispora tengchongensis TaxID=1073253 RepID=A0A840PAP2_9ACTN|nr:glycosyl hydrolase [Thermocatellispora tengchongensis]MBB5134931.1 endoglucanase Acf2 [Thermocatellispora tengchongensis]